MEKRSWRDAFVRPTRQYVAGIMGGFGLGIWIGSWLGTDWYALIIIPGLSLAAIGSYLAQADQQPKEPRESVKA